MKTRPSGVSARPGPGFPGAFTLFGSRLYRVVRPGFRFVSLAGAAGVLAVIPAGCGCSDRSPGRAHAGKPRQQAGRTGGRSLPGSTDHRNRAAAGPTAQPPADRPADPGKTAVAKAAGAVRPGPPAGRPEPIPLPRSPVRPGCNPVYARLLSALDVEQACGYRGPAPVTFPDPWGCVYGYPGLGSLAVVGSPSYRKLRRAFRSGRFLRLPTGAAFVQMTRDHRAVTVVLRLADGKALVLQAPVKLCTPEALQRLASVVSLRIRRSPRLGF